LLVPPGDHVALAAALRRLLEDGALRQRLALAAKQRALAEFDIRVMADRYERLYRAAPRRRARSATSAASSGAGSRARQR
jgi:rhamnosyl/mannosyltransferase